MPIRDAPRYRLTRSVIAAAWTTALACLAMPTVPAADWVGMTSEHRVERKDLDRLLADHPLPAGDNIKVLPVYHSALTAHLLVQVRDREPLHYHADSDISVHLLRGQGKLRLGEATIAVKAGDVLHVPRGVVHAYINDGPEVGVAFVIYSPAPGPDDRVLVEPRRP